MNGLTGRKMQRIFEALAPEHAQFDARSLVEYCCFRYLSRDSSDFHPGLKVCSIPMCSYKNEMDFCCLLDGLLYMHSALILFQEPAFQRLIFLTMLAWEQPYSTGSDLQVDSENSSLQVCVLGW